MKNQVWSKNIGELVELIDVNDILWAEGITNERTGAHFPRHYFFKNTIRLVVLKDNPKQSLEVGDSNPDIMREVVREIRGVYGDHFEKMPAFRVIELIVLTVNLLIEVGDVELREVEIPWD